MGDLRIVGFSLEGVGDEFYDSPRTVVTLSDDSVRCLWTEAREDAYRHFLLGEPVSEAWLASATRNVLPAPGRRMKVVAPS